MSETSNKAYRISRTDLLEAIASLEIRANKCDEYGGEAYLNAIERATWRKQAKHFRAVAKRIQKALDK